MYFIQVILLMFVLPVASVTIAEVRSPHPANMVFLMGQWFVFWAVGVRLFVAGARQVAQPGFTAEQIFDIHDSKSFAIVRELGFANLSVGLLGICSVVRPGWIVPEALVGGLYYGLAGAGHIPRKAKNAKEYTAMVSDAFAFVVLLLFLLRTLV